MTEERFFELGKEILLSLRPERMHYRNEFIMRTPDLPTGLYWGVYTTLSFPGIWKIDIWAMDSDQIDVRQRKIDELRSKINEDNRGTILEIKGHFCQHPEYRKRFYALDIYRAVIEEDVRSIRGFSEWLEKNKGVVGGFT